MLLAVAAFLTLYMSEVSLSSLMPKIIDLRIGTPDSELSLCWVHSFLSCYYSKLCTLHSIQPESFKTV